MSPRRRNESEFRIIPRAIANRYRSMADAIVEIPSCSIPTTLTKPSSFLDVDRSIDHFSFSMSDVLSRFSISSDSEINSRRTLLIFEEYMIMKSM